MPIDVAAPMSENLAESARAMLRAGRPGAARPLVAALRRLEPKASAIALLESELAESEGRIPEAIAALEPALQERPRDPALLKRRSVLRHQAGEERAALADASEAVLAAPNDAAAKALLGLLLIERGETAPARACLAEASQAEPDNADYRLGFAEAALRGGETALARKVLAEGVRRSPRRSDLREAAIRYALRSGDVEEAERLAHQARDAGFANAVIFRLLGEAVSARGHGKEAARWFAEALKLEPQNPSLRFLAAREGGLPAPERAPAELVRAHFESAAGDCAARAIAAGNRVPGLMRAAVGARLPLPPSGRLGPVLDLGCGAGLAGVALSDLPLGPFIGVDLSPSMLQAAHSWGLYAELVEADLIDFLTAEPRLFPLIVAADVLPWFGALKPVFAALAPRLERAGKIILSLEAMCEVDRDNAGYSLGGGGRYSHSPEALETSAREAGLQLIHIASEALRAENGAAVPGFIAVLARSDAAG